MLTNTCTDQDTDQIYWSNILINILIKYTAQIYWPIYWSIYWSNILIKYTAQIYWSIYWPIYWPVYWAVDAYWHRHYTFNFARTCMIRKWGLLTFSWTDRKRSCTREGVALLPLIRYLFRPPITTYKYTCSTKAYIQMLSGPLRGTSFHGCISQPPYRLPRVEWTHRVLHHSYNKPITRMLKTSDVCTCLETVISS